MATEEQLNVVIKTVADTSGAQQVSQALQQTQRVASGAQTQLNTRQEAANATLRALMDRHGQTLDAFQKASQSVTQSLGTTPTLLPRDFGIQAAQAAAATKVVADTTKGMGEAFRLSSAEVARFGVAFLGAGIGLSAFSAAGQLAHAALQSVITGTVDLDRATRDNAISLGQQAAGFQAWATTVSDQTGQTRQSLLEAGTAASQFARQVGIGPEQTQSLVALATALANIRGADVGTTMQQLTAAMSGNGQAAQQLGLQLDAASIAYTQLGGATADVFNQLDPGTQATLRYEAAVGQIAKQAGGAVGPVTDLQKAQRDLNVEWEKFASQTGPGVLKLLSQIASTAAGGAKAWGALVDAQVAASKAGGTTAPGNTLPEELDRLKQTTGNWLDEQGRAVTEWQHRVGAGFAELGTDIQQSGAAQAVQDVNDQLRDTTGFDAMKTAQDLVAAGAQKVADAVNAAGAALTGLKDNAANVGGALAAPLLQAADAADRAAASAERDNRLRALGEQVAGPAANLAAARQNEIEAARALTNLRQQSVELAAQEAAIRLDMLPAAQRMLELQNATSRAQIEATQRALPASRGLQDLQTQIEEQRLLATSGGRTLAERQAALRAGASLAQGLPEAQLAALRANATAVPAQRAAQDVQAQAQLQALEQASALFGVDFAKQQISLLAQIATAAKDAAQRTVAISIQAVNLAVNQSGPITDQDEQRIAALAGDEIARLIHQAVQSVSTRKAPAQLLAGG